MALVLANRVKETTTVTGTGDVSLLGAVPGYQSFAVVGNGNLTYYCITEQVGNSWEIGIGEFVAPSTLRRTGPNALVLNSSLGGSPVPFTSGTKDVFITLPSSQAVFYDNLGNVGIGTSTPTAVLDVSGDANISGAASFDSNVIIGSAAQDGQLTIGPSGGGAGAAPIKLVSGGVTLSTPEIGAIEYDDVVLYFTGNSISGRGYVPNTQYRRLASNGTSIGTTATNFFGTNSAIELDAGRYEIEANCYFFKGAGGTAATVTVTILTSAAPFNLSGVLQYGGTSGNGAANQNAQFNITSTTAAFAPTISLALSTNHCFIIKLSVDANISNLRIMFTSGSGTILPLRNSYYKVTRFPDFSTGNFVA